MVKPVVVPPKPLEEELPMVESLTWRRTPKGWVVILLRSRGDRILETETLHEPQAKAYAAEQLKVAVVTRLILAKVTDGA